MNATLDQLKQSASALSLEDRAELAEFLLGTLDPEEEAEADKEWCDLAADRIEELKSGKVKGIPLEEALRQLEEPAP